LNTDALYPSRSELRGITFKNKSYGEWGDIFKDHVIAAAILDRVLHHCTTVNIKGDSYRIKDRKRQGLIPQNFSI
jgi:DNA replication protein DnaC